MKKTIFTFICIILSCQLLSAQNWDVNTLHTINQWHTHGLSRGLSHSGMILPVGIPTAMGVYALIQKDQKLLKEAVFIGTSVIEAVGITYGLKHLFDRQRPYDKYPNKIHRVGPAESSPSLRNKWHRRVSLLHLLYRVHHCSIWMFHRY